MFFMGEAGRSTAQHVLNSNSSRSHCIFTVHLEMRGSSDASERAIKSKASASTSTHQATATRCAVASAAYNATRKRPPPPQAAHCLAG